MRVSLRPIRAILITTLCALLGALTTVGVAWFFLLNKPAPAPTTASPVLLAPIERETILRSDERFTLRLFEPTIRFGVTDYSQMAQQKYQYDVVPDSALADGVRHTDTWLPRRPNGFRWLKFEGGDFNPGGSFYISYECIDSIPDQRHAITPGELNNDSLSRNETQCGWPFRALWMYVDMAMDYRTVYTPVWVHALFLRKGATDSLSGIITLPKPGNEPVIVPTGILPLGFAINTAIYALAWSPLVFIPGALIRRSRRKHNRCIHCAYDLRATPTGKPCPECGNLA